MSTALAALTPRQRQVCDLVVRGKSNKEIGRLLGISSRTVEEHRADVYRRLNVRNAIELVQWFWQRECNRLVSEMGAMR